MGDHDKEEEGFSEQTDTPVQESDGDIPEDWEDLPEEWYERDWLKWLQGTLQFPFAAERIDDDDEAYFVEGAADGPLRLGHQIQVLALEDEDEGYGILVAAKEGRHRAVVPLADLDVVPKTDPNHQLVHDYALWFANRD